MPSWTKWSRPLLPTPQTTQEVILEKKGQGEMLRDALTKLSPEHREIIDLVYYQKKSVDDAADILSIPRATVKTRMFLCPQEAR
jgi:RNA polymerase sigma-70 factor (ECF subfamily)